MSPTWELEQIEKRLRLRSEKLAEGVTIENLPEELTIEGIAEHFQRSTSEITDLIVPKHEHRHG